LSSTAAGSVTGSAGRAVSLARPSHPIRGGIVRSELHTNALKTSTAIAEAILSNDDLADIYAYLRSIPH
jgi:hypothetical protein